MTPEQLALRRILVELKLAELFGLTMLPGGAPSTATATAESPMPKAREASRKPAAAATPEFDRVVGSVKEREAIVARLQKDVSVCTRCKLHATRTRTVFGEGPLGAELMFVGEGPGADEDASGRPFVGRAGQLLTKIIEAMGRQRDDVYIANVVKCRPPENRTPEPDEIGSCLPYLHEQIRQINPRVICALGAPATKTLLGITTAMGQARGKIYRLGHIRVVPTYHPAYLLRNPADKRKVWEDVQLVNRLLAEPEPT
jgi:DNA polymerase